MPSKKLTGSFVALITPFNRDGSVDFAAFRTLLKFHADNGTSAILIMGSTGESSIGRERWSFVCPQGRAESSEGRFSSSRKRSFCHSEEHQ